MRIAPAQRPHEPWRTVSIAALAIVLMPHASGAQSIGTFRWQLQPFCNIVSLTITQNGGVYELDGTDDQCGAAQAASASGTAFVNPDGSIGLGVAIVSAPSGTPVHVEASISLSTLGGTWHDSAGSSGLFVFTAGGGIGGAPRPPTTLGLSGVSLGFGLATTGSPGNVSVNVDVSQVKGGLDLRTPDETSLALGSGALTSVEAEADFNTALGALALSALTSGHHNTAVGESALTATTFGSGNTAVGKDALKENTSGGANIGIGYRAAVRASGSNNIAVGVSALRGPGAGERNVAIGFSALQNATANDTIAIGYGAGANLFLSNNIAIGNAGDLNDQNTIRIGGPSHTRTFIGGIAGRAAPSGVGVFITNTGALGTVTSSARFKDDIRPIGDVRERLQALRPVRFIYKPEYDDGLRTPQFGLVAEEVAEAFPELVARDETGQPWTVRYHLLAPLLLAEVQRLERERAQLESRVETLARELASFKQRMGKR